MTDETVSPRDATASLAEIRRVLCPTDLSEASDQAARLANALAEWAHAQLTGLFVLSPLALALPRGGDVQRPEPSESEFERLRRETARRFAGNGAGGVEVDPIVDVGRPVERILDRAAQLPADLIVMGTHGPGGIERFIVGSVAEMVVRRAPCPVITVAARADVGSRVPFRHVVCAMDDSDSSRSALEYAMALARRSDASLTLLHVIEWPWDEPPTPRFEDLPAQQGAALAEYRRYRETTATNWLHSCVPESAPERLVKTRVAHGKPRVQLLAVAAEEGADLIVMGVGRRSAVDMTLFGSTTRHVVAEATCPVLTLRR